MAMDPQQMEKSCDTPRIAVIILNWNGEALLREYLPRVAESTDPAISRLIVADNGSTDGSLDYVRSTFGEKVEIMAFPENYGFAEGYNRAIAAAEGFPYVVLLNSDLVTTPGWDHTLLDYMETNPTTAACQPKILSLKQPDTFEYAGACGGFIDRNGYPYCRGRIFTTCEKDHGQYDEPMDVFWASGACLMVRRQLYLDAGGLDPKFFAHMEEIDLCWRLKLAGYHCAAVPAATVYHLGGGSLPAENPRKTYLNFRNNLIMLYKNLPRRGRRAFLFRRRLLDTLAWLKYIATFDTANAGAIVRAHRDFAHMRRQYHTDVTKNLLHTEPGSGINILTAYFIRGLRSYAQLQKV